MLETIGTNLSKRNADVRLYELATVYLPVDGELLADERTTLCMGACGHDSDFFSVKGCVEAVLKALRVENLRFSAVADNPSYHPGRCAAVRSGETPLGFIGQVHPKVSEAFGIDCDVVAVELDIPHMLASRSPEKRYVPLPRFPAVMRDIAVVCDERVTVSSLMDTITGAGGPYLKDCRLFDVYTGAPIPEGKRSLAFSLTLRSEDQTLTDEHAEETCRNVLAALEKIHGAVIR
jgi:phenylalanyl-tRNA synthetase beta chain